MIRNRFGIGLGVLVAVLITGLGCGDRRRIDYSVPALVKSLKHNDADMRYWAAQSLGSFGPGAEAAVPDLIEALGDEQKMVRMGAAYALGEIGDPKALPALRTAIKDSQKEVRDAASFASKQIQTKKKR